ncbi:hypothetical protein COE61_16065 [Bacillus thuringiensis]|nr:hypothetical protein COJ82_00055 [Bacillus cereus]PGZ79420.1 hypothetical protein COE61_16065 [Bacillus thuringiensis]
MFILLIIVGASCFC